MEQRLRQIKDVLGISENEFAKRLGIAQSTLNSYTLGKRKPSSEFSENLLNTFVDISAEWFMRGEGEMLISDIPTDGDTDTILDLKAEITRLRAERDELRDELIAQRAVSKYQEKQLRELMGIAHPRASIAADSRVSYATDNILK